MKLFLKVKLLIVLKQSRPKINTDTLLKERLIIKAHIRNIKLVIITLSKSYFYLSELNKKEKFFYQIMEEKNSNGIGSLM